MPDGRPDLYGGAFNIPGITNAGALPLFQMMMGNPWWKQGPPETGLEKGRGINKKFRDDREFSRKRGVRGERGRDQGRGLQRFGTPSANFLPGIPSPIPQPMPLPQLRPELKNNFNPPFANYEPGFPAPQPMPLPAPNQIVTGGRPLPMPINPTLLGRPPGYQLLGGLNFGG